MCCAVLSSSVTEFEVHLCLGLVEGWSCLRIGIDASHVERDLITMSLSVRCFTTDVNRGDVVEVLDMRLSPIYGQLRSSVYFVVLPSAQCRGVVAASSCPSFCVNGFHDPFAIGCVRSFSLLTELLRYESTEFSKM